MDKIKRFQAVRPTTELGQNNTDTESRRFSNSKVKGRCSILNYSFNGTLLQVIWQLWVAPDLRYARNSFREVVGLGWDEGRWAGGIFLYNQRFPQLCWKRRRSRDREWKKTSFRPTWQGGYRAVLLNLRLTDCTFKSRLGQWWVDA